MTEKREVSAVGVSVTCNLGESRQMVLQCHFASDASDDEKDAVVDGLFRVSDRQKAKYDLEKLESEFATVGQTLSNLIDALPHGERTAKIERARRVVSWEEKKRVRQETYESAYNTWRQRGNEGAFGPRGHEKATLDRMDSDIAAAAEAVARADADKAQALQDIEKSILHYQQDLARRRVIIDAKRALCGQMPCNDYFSEQVFRFEMPKAA